MIAMMGKIWDWLQVMVTCPRWVILLAFIVGLVISIVVKALWNEWELERTRSFLSSDRR